jgi:hypothetical protein
MVPMQKNSALSNSYACFTIIFILTGLTTLASSINLLVLHLASLTAEEKVQEKLEADEARRQMVHLDGDIINLHDRTFEHKENPEMLVDNVSVCSCNCMQSFSMEQRKRKKNNKSSKKSNSPNETIECDKLALSKFSLKETNNKSTSKPWQQQQQPKSLLKEKRIVKLKTSLPQSKDSKPNETDINNNSNSKSQLS